MDFSIILWIGGMLFSLGIFAVKVGFGLGYGRIGIKGISVTLAGYVLLFTILALLSGKLMGVLTPLLSKGPYVHILMATGLIAWGLYTIRGSHDRRPCGPKTVGAPLGPSLLLIVPCPICLTAMAFSTWTSLGVIKLPAVLVGLGLGIAFAVLTLLVLFVARFGKSRHPETSLGLVMIAIGLYFFASLQIPAKIEEARGVYASFVDRGTAVDHADTVGVFLLLLVAILAGYFIRQKEFKK
ncbi:MAG: DUF2162 domain-containing protein [Proteobacteria bacterium]|nr:DUF2162 domain-containing protein [Pseudomonadota bacterium]MBU2226927.1 DUF2162 domain-containing protein [Pseudomonadota bacterium]MBU2262419.1 DUF2162 domain-containing protein [Pseudomonadota bacterium]